MKAIAVLIVVISVSLLSLVPFTNYMNSGSMMPTLLVGDLVLVNKLAYGIRLPKTRSLILETGSPKRGDLAVFKYPRNPAEDIVKRVVGIPGDLIEFRNRTLYVNGVAQRTEALGTLVGVGSGQMMTGATVFREHMGDTPHEILMWEAAPGMTGSVRVPEGHYFMVGDNRDNSNDSRMWGFVSEDLLVGRALLVLVHLDHRGRHRDWSRVGQRLN